MTFSEQQQILYKEFLDKYIGDTDSAKAFIEWCKYEMADVSKPVETAKPKDTKSLPPVLDAACGGRMFWFDKQNPDTLFVDSRVMPPTEVGHGIHKRTRQCLPDKVMDFRKLDLPSNHFSLVVFDPPHLFLGKNSHTAKVYGSLDKETWQDDLRRGFAECFRVLKPEGVLVFKWHEFNVPLREILKLMPHQPLFGHKSGKAQLTHWLCFMKPTTKGIDLPTPDPKPSTGHSEAQDYDPNTPTRPVDNRKCFKCLKGEGHNSLPNGDSNGSS